MNTTQTKLPKAIEEAFEKATLNIDDTSIIKEISCGSGYCSHDVIDEEKVKQFIAQALQNQTEEYRKRIEEIINKNKLPVPNPYGDFVRVENVNNKVLEKVKFEVLDIFKETK